MARPSWKGGHWTGGGEDRYEMQIMRRIVCSLIKIELGLKLKLKLRQEQGLRKFIIHQSASSIISAPASLTSQIPNPSSWILKSSNPHCPRRCTLRWTLKSFCAMAGGYIFFLLRGGLGFLAKILYIYYIWSGGVWVKMQILQIFNFFSTKILFSVCTSCCSPRTLAGPTLFYLPVCQGCWWLAPLYSRCLAAF